MEAFTATVEHYWNPKWVQEISTAASGQFRRSMGDGIWGFLQSFYEVQSNGFKYFLTKTPSINGLEFVRQYFPQARIIVIVRDGRDLVESGMKSFGWKFEYAVRDWANNVRSLIKFEKTSPGNFCRVRFEDLFSDPRGELSKIFGMLELDCENYDFGDIEQAPVIGSSETMHTSGNVHWKPQEKSKNFKPVGRWNEWLESRKSRFYWIASRELEAQGYDLINKKSRSFSETLTQSVNDMFWLIRRAVYNSVTFLKAMKHGRIQKFWRQIKTSEKRF